MAELRDAASPEGFVCSRGWVARPCCGPCFAGGGRFALLGVSEVPDVRHTTDETAAAPAGAYDATRAVSRATDETLARSAVLLRRLEATIAARRVTLEELDETLARANRLSDGVTVDLVALEAQEATLSSWADRSRPDPVG